VGNKADQDAFLRQVRAKRCIERTERMIASGQNSTTNSGFNSFVGQLGNRLCVPACQSQRLKFDAERAEQKNAKEQSPSRSISKLHGRSITCGRAGALHLLMRRAGRIRGRFRRAVRRCDESVGQQIGLHFIAADIG